MKKQILKKERKKEVASEDRQEIEKNGKIFEYEKPGVQQN